MTDAATGGAVRVPALAPGDRAPNLTLPDLGGRTRKLYLEVTGGPVVVVTVPDPLSGPGRVALDGLARRAGQFRQAGAHCFVLTRRPPADPDVLGALVWIDPYGDAMALFRPSREDGEPSIASAAVLDANQRLVAIFPAESYGDPVAEAARLAETLAAAMTAGAHDLDRPAPVLVLPRLLPSGLCDRLAARGAGQPVQDPDTVRDVAQRLGARLGNEIRRVFQFRPVLRFDPFRIVDAATTAAARGATEEQPRRRFVVLVGLGAGNPGVAFPEFGPHVYRLEKGAAAAFSCELLYRPDAGSGTAAPVLATALAEPQSQA
ncbi:MAG: hypothetical protein RLO51_14305 [Thalassobaculum sp.]|uniref:hypothetical protein n=1 Tax=Thalassobaculum sp. TaxID=2022740 RepID=UPI0032EB85A0